MSVPTIYEKNQRVAFQQLPSHQLVQIHETVERIKVAVNKIGYLFESEYDPIFNLLINDAFIKLTPDLGLRPICGYTAYRVGPKDVDCLASIQDNPVSFSVWSQMGNTGVYIDLMPLFLDHKITALDQLEGIKTTVTYQFPHPLIFTETAEDIKHVIDCSVAGAFAHRISHRPVKVIEKLKTDAYKQLLDMLVMVASPACDDATVTIFDPMQ